MKLFLISVLVTFVSSQTTIDPEVLYAIFNITRFPNPVTESTTMKQNLVSSTTVSTGLGDNCQCVPYYLCDDNLIGLDINNSSITGYGQLDIRFGDDDERECAESIEFCCTIPADPEKPTPLPDPKKVKGCGYRNPNGLDVTFNYANTQFGEFPWVVALLDSRNDNYTGVGVLIHPEVVMTGAHVVIKYTPETLKIRAGEWDTKTDREIYKHEERQVKEIYLHQNFKRKTLWHDIALLRLERPLELTEHINTICLPEQDEVFDNYKNCVANGWGKNEFGSKASFAVILKKVEVNMLTYDRCTTLLKKTRLGSNFKLHSSFVCAGGEEGKDACQGDGGAPLACPIGDDRYKLTGLVAWGIGCGQKDVPAVYTNVPKFRDWVDRKMEHWGLLDTTSYTINDNN